MMVTRGRYIFGIFVAVVATAALTSLVWLILFNLHDRTAGSPDAATSSEAAAPVTTSQVPPARSAPGAPLDASGDIAALTAKHLTLPVTGIAPAQLVDTFTQSRGGGARPHDAIDILAPRGTPVVAVEDGRIAKLFLSKLGGNTIYQFDPSEQFAYYYAHLDHYAPGIAEGQVVRRGTVIGYVGFTGDAIESAPHLHFAISRLGPEKHWWQGAALNPFQPLGGTLRPGGSLSTP